MKAAVNKAARSMIESVKLEPGAFWDEIDSIFEAVKEWVLINCIKREYQCCGMASDILYRLLVDWGIESYKEDGLDTYIVVGIIRGIEHHWVEISEFVFDPTAMQFDSELTIEEYSDGMVYIDYHYNNILDSEEILDVCKTLRPDIYNANRMKL